MKLEESIRDETFLTWIFELPVGSPLGYCSSLDRQSEREVDSEIVDFQEMVKAAFEAAWDTEGNFLRETVIPKDNASTLGKVVTVFRIQIRDPCSDQSSVHQPS